MQGDTTPSTDCDFSEHVLIFPYWSGPRKAELPHFSQRKSPTPAWAAPIVRLRARRIIARFVVAIAPFVCQMTALTVLESNVRAQTPTRSEAIDRFAEFIAEASARFAIPASWIRAVMLIESGGDQRARRRPVVHSA